MAKKREHADVYGASERKYIVAFQKRKDKFLSPVLKLFMKLGITANMLSYMSIILGILFFVYIQKDIGIALWIIIAAVAFDLMDGSLARISKKTSLRGSLADGISDQVFITLTSIGFALVNIVELWVAIAYLVLYNILFAVIVIRNMRKIPFKIAFKPRLWTYLLFLIYVVWQINILNPAMLFFSGIMFVEIIIGLFKIKKVLK